VSLRRLRMPQGILTAGQKSAEGRIRFMSFRQGLVRHSMPKGGGQQIGRAGNGD